ncbi:YqgE/AlgH family protein [uncultured Sulfitobacter sp.]|uniref:YqgE/AlgH family protein n=1 Tax=uncultured Sulfitobacter sp. TaxID=191468 RepID=UPI00263593FA|nr:YqgE/AlgH family protein [uncultured Sulfitobacter sp.]
MELAGQLLIAMPGMTDPRFTRSVIFICAYSDDGAMGLIVNKPVQDKLLRDVIEQLSLDTGPALADAPVYFGGPVETDRGFVLHAAEQTSLRASLEVPGAFSVTGTQDILRDIGNGTGPDKFLFALGYAGWGAGQLEEEIAQNGWLTAPATAELMFGTTDDGKWDAAVRSIGIEPVSLSSTAGRA